MILYGSSFSPFVRKVMVYGAEKGLSFDIKPVGIGDTDPGFGAASPLRKMPALTDGDFSIADSSAIITYLEAKHTAPALIPTGAQDRARTIWFEEFADTVLGAVVGKVFFNRVVAPIFMKREGDEAVAVEGETQDLPKLLDYLEGVVPDAGGFLVGGSLSLADIAVASPFVNFDHACRATDKAKWPRTFAWLATIHARESYAGIIAIEKKMLRRD